MDKRLKQQHDVCLKSRKNKEGNAEEREKKKTSMEMRFEKGSCGQNTLTH